MYGEKCIAFWSGNLGKEATWKTQTQMGII